MDCQHQNDQWRDQNDPWRARAPFISAATSVHRSPALFRIPCPFAFNSELRKIRGARN